MTALGNGADGVKCLKFLNLVFLSVNEQSEYIYLGRVFVFVFCSRKTLRSKLSFCGLIFVEF